ncbi:MAG: Rpn family recombination-promoting nuclease/putative transposase [Deltaproteobacteria bacterium]|nr:Rpn family recombination-promoting nuclease/putative transposase [Deltaproteobacteria bacterium]
MIYHGASNWTEPFTLSSLFDIDSQFTRFFPEFEYLLYDLSVIKDEDIRGAAMTGELCCFRNTSTMTAYRLS